MVCFDRCITVFSYNGKSYDRMVFEGVSVFGGEGIELSDGVFRQKAEYKIRIPAQDELSIKCGDRVVFGNADIFDTENACTIMKIKDNRIGYLKHYLLEIK